MKNAKDYFGARAKLIECQSIEDCIRMVQEKNDCNATLLPSKRAELVRMSDYKNEYALALLADQTISYSLVVKQFPYNKLSALLANTVNMSTSDEINLLTLAHMDSASGKISLIEIFYERPLLFIGIIAIVVVELFVILLYTLKGKREIAQKNENLQKDNIFLKKRDSLTGGYNRNGFLSEIERLYMQNVDLTEYDILYINIKRFKVVNHMIGSENGDEIIKHLYCTVRDSLLQPELCARIEADHFAFLVRKDRLDVYLLENILHLQKEVGGKVLKPRCLCGIYQIEDMETEGSRMLNDASIALHYITDDSAVLYKFYDQNMREDYVDQAEILATYKSAIKKKEFKIHYQPIIEASTGKVASAEALVRWQKEDGRLIRPDLFIPILEKNGHISKLDSFVESSVYNFLLERQQADKVRVPVSVNLSWMDFHDKAFIEKMQERGSGITLEENTLRYEITETAYAALEGNKRALLQQLNKNGIEIVLDDFGSGYSSFGMIKDYEFGILKIDMSFIRQIVENEKVRIIVNYIIAMCHHLKIRVVAEGVETEREVELLREMKCDYLQGYYFSKPLSEEDFVKYIEGNMH